jgi:nucleotide-binding universal stress UspA family protein
MFKKILVPLDRSPLAEDALGQATAIARAAHATLDVVLVHQAVPFGGFVDAPWNAAQLSEERKYLESITTELESGAGVDATHNLLEGSPVEMICRHVADAKDDLIVMTSHGRTGISRAWLGSVADGLLRHSQIPVLLLRPLDRARAKRAARHLFKHILVPLDDSVLSEDILPAATALAACGDARITLLRVVEPVPVLLLEAGLPFAYSQTARDDDATERAVDDAKRHLDQVARRVRDESGIEVQTQVVVAGPIAQAVLEFARTHEIDAIAMSTHGRGASRLLMGSVADKTVRASELPVLLSCPAALGDRTMFTAESVAEQLPALSVGGLIL